MCPACQEHRGLRWSQGRVTPESGAGTCGDGLVGASPRRVGSIARERLRSRCEPCSLCSGAPQAGGLSLTSFPGACASTPCVRGRMWASTGHHWRQSLRPQQHGREERGPGNRRRDELCWTSSGTGCGQVRCPPSSPGAAPSATQQGTTRLLDYPGESDPTGPGGGPALPWQLWQQPEAAADLGPRKSSAQAAAVMLG